MATNSPTIAAEPNDPPEHGRLPRPRGGHGIHHVQQGRRGYVYLDGEDASLGRGRDPDEARATPPRGDPPSSSRPRAPARDHCPPPPFGDGTLPEGAAGGDSSSDDSAVRECRERVAGGGVGAFSFSRPAPDPDDLRRPRHAARPLPPHHRGARGGGGHRVACSSDRDLRNHPKRRAKEAKDSDLDALRGGAHRRSQQSQFADRTFRSAQQPAWRDRRVSFSSASVDAADRSIASPTAAARAAAADRDDGAALRDVAARLVAACRARAEHCRSQRHGGYLQKKVVRLALVAGLSAALVGMTFPARGAAAAAGRKRAARGEGARTDPPPPEDVARDMRPAAPGIMEGARPDGGGGGELQQLLRAVDWEKVPPHLRGYYAKLSERAGRDAPPFREEEARPSAAAAAEEQRRRREEERAAMEALAAITAVGNEGRSDGGDAAVVAALHVPAVDGKEFERQQGELERNAGVPGAGGAAPATPAAAEGAAEGPRPPLQAEAQAEAVRQQEAARREERARAEASQAEERAQSEADAAQYNRMQAEAREEAAREVARQTQAAEAREAEEPRPTQEAPEADRPRPSPSEAGAAAAPQQTQLEAEEASRQERGPAEATEAAAGEAADALPPQPEAEEAAQPQRLQAEAGEAAAPTPSSKEERQAQRRVEREDLRRAPRAADPAAGPPPPAVDAERVAAAE